MIVVKLQGGMGNQMFQYALGRHLSLRHRTQLYLDISSFEDISDPLIIKRQFDLSVFNIQAAIAPLEIIEKCKRADTRLGKIISLLNPRIYQYVHEHKPGFDPRILHVRDNTYLDGYWQSEKYFADYKDIIRQDFSIRAEMPLKVCKLAGRILKTESACIHVRRADFVHHARTRKCHGFCDIDYFDKAVSVLRDKIENPQFFIFSDDPEWCRNHILPRYGGEIIEHEYNGERSEWHLYLIACCKHQIISNSSFGWWGAWLNTNPNKIVIAPDHWTNDPKDKNDRIPGNWIRL